MSFTKSGTDKFNASTVAGTSTSFTVNVGTTNDLRVVTTQMVTQAHSVASLSGGGVTTWTQIGTPFVDSDSGITHQMWYGSITSAGTSLTFTFDSAISTGVAMAVLQNDYRSSNSGTRSWVVETHDTISSPSAATVTFPSLNSVNAGELYVGVGFCANTSVAGSTTGFTYVIDTDGNPRCYNLNLSASTAYQPTATQSPAGAYGAIAAIIDDGSISGTAKSSSDTATGTDVSASINATQSASEVGRGTDAGSANATVSSADTATGTLLGGFTLSSADAATGTDSGSLVAAGSGSDSATATDFGAASAFNLLSAADASFDTSPVGSAPTLVQYAETTWSGTGTKSTGTISWLAGDLIVIIFGVESQSAPLAAPTATGLTFSPGTAITTANSCWANSYTATAGSSGGPVAVSSNGPQNTKVWGMAVWVFRGQGTGGAVAAPAASSSKTASLVRTGSDSLVALGSFDFNAGVTTGYSFTPTVADDRQHGTVSTKYSYYVADFGDQGAAGTTSYGTSGETSSGPFSTVAVEVPGSSGIATAWSAATCASAAAVSADTANDGTQSLKLTRNAAAAPGVMASLASSHCPIVSPSTAYQFFYFAYTSASGVQMCIDVDWYKSDLTTYISSTTDLAVTTLTPNQWTLVGVVQATSPALAGQARMFPAVHSGGANGDSIYVDSIFAGTVPNVSLADSGAGTDAGSVATLIVSGDTATGTDAGAFNAMISGAESGTAADTYTDRSLRTADTAAGTDAATLATAVSDAEAATATDLSAGVGAGAAPSGSDSATGTGDSKSINAALSSSDTASGSDLPVTIAISSSDTASMFDDTNVPITGADSAAATDAGTLVASTSSADTATGATSGNLPVGSTVNLLSANASSVETSIGSWFAGACASACVQSTDVAYVGSHSIKLTKGSLGAPGALAGWGVGQALCTPSTAYSVLLWAYTAQSGFQLCINLDWYKADQTTLISSSNNLATRTLIPNQWNLVGVASVTSPALAGEMRGTVQLLAGGAPGDLVYIDAVFAGQNPPLAASDTAAGTDAGDAFTGPPTPISGSDAATGTDAGTLSALMSAGDAATGTDVGAIGGVPIIAGDAASGSDASAGIAVAVSSTDGALSSDAGAPFGVPVVGMEFALATDAGDADPGYGITLLQELAVFGEILYRFTCRMHTLLDGRTGVIRIVWTDTGGRFVDFDEQYVDLTAHSWTPLQLIATCPSNASKANLHVGSPVSATGDSLWVGSIRFEAIEEWEV